MSPKDKLTGSRLGVEAFSRLREEGARQGRFQGGAKGRRGKDTMLSSRVAGRLSTDLILRSPQYMNACEEYELDLRGNKIGAIENLGGTENQFDCIDLSDNEIVKLEGFPLLPKLKTLVLNHNRISR